METKPKRNINFEGLSYDYSYVYSKDAKEWHGCKETFLEEFTSGSNFFFAIKRTIYDTQPIIEYMQKLEEFLEFNPSTFIVHSPIRYPNYSVIQIKLSKDWQYNSMMRSIFMQCLRDKFQKGKKPNNLILAIKKFGYKKFLKKSPTYDSYCSKRYFCNSLNADLTKDYKLAAGRKEDHAGKIVYILPSNYYRVNGSAWLKKEFF